jgi:hypothetical protein
MQFSGHCPIDVIFPIWVAAERAREFVPRGYEIGTEPAGTSMIIISLVACEDTVVDGVTRDEALYSDLLFQVNPPPASGTPLVDRFLDGYWAWVVTDEPAVHSGLTRMGMFHGFDPDMSVSATRTGDRVVAVDGEVKWAQAPFRLHADVLDLTPAGWPEYTNYFWQDVADGRMLAKLHKRAGDTGYAEAARMAQFTLTTPSGSRLGRLLGCAAGGEDCSVSGGGIVTELPRFEYDISVQPPASRDPAAAERGERRCLASRSPIGRRNIGRVRLGQSRRQLLGLPVEPVRRTRRSYRFCVEGGQGRVTAVFSRRGRVVLVTSTAPGHGNRGVRPGRSANAVRAAYPGRRDLGGGRYRAGRASTSVIGIRNGRVRFVAVADRALLRRPRLLRRHLRFAAL